MVAYKTGDKIDDNELVVLKKYKRKKQAEEMIQNFKKAIQKKILENKQAEQKSEESVHDTIELPDQKGSPSPDDSQEDKHSTLLAKDLQ